MGSADWSAATEWAVNPTDPTSPPGINGETGLGVSGPSPLQSGVSGLEWQRSMIHGECDDGWIGFPTCRVSGLFGDPSKDGNLAVQPTNQPVNPSPALNPQCREPGYDPYDTIRSF